MKVAEGGNKRLKEQETKSRAKRDGVRRSRSKQGTVFGVQAENISRMFGDGASAQIKITASNASAAAIAQMRIAIARTMGLRNNGTKGPKRRIDQETEARAIQYQEF